ncbi:MAG: PqqD family protein [Bacteroidota bacterium]
MITDDTHVRAVSQQVSSELTGEAVILNLNDGIYYGLNEVGARIWTLVQEGTVFRSIKETLLQEYDVPEDQCDAEVRRILEEMHTYGLVELSNE